MTKLEALKKAGKVASHILREIGQLAIVGTNFLDIEKFAVKIIADNGMQASFYGYKGYPNATCLSVNSEIVHSIPRNYQIRKGDVLSVDLGVTCEGWIVDTARTYVAGKTDQNIVRLVNITRLALKKAMSYCKAGNTIGDIGAIIQQTVEQNGYAIVKELHGHGVGRSLQEPPTIPNYGTFGSGKILEEGMVLAIEPITSLVPTHIHVENDNWTITADKDIPTAHFEDTVVIRRSDPLILTK